MSTYDLVNTALHTQHGWSPFACPAPDPTNLALNGGQSVDSVVSMLHADVQNLFMGSSFYPTYEQASYSRYVENGHYWVLDTAIALGQQHEIPTEKVAPAHTVAAWLSNMNHGFTRQGEHDANQSPYTDEGKRRIAAAKVPPAEWLGHEQIWELAVRSEKIKVNMTGFDPAYANQSPTLREIRGLDAQQFMDNEWVPNTWLPTQPAKGK